MKSRVKTCQLKFFLLVTALFFLSSCYNVSVEVTDVPANTPAGAPIYISGNFNNWDPGDESYRLQLQADSTYVIVLPLGYGRIEYKFTRGDWSTVEKDWCGYEIDNRFFYYGEQEHISDSVLCWADKAPINCPHVVIILKELPENTPGDARISLAGSVNNWDPTDEQYQFRIDDITGLPILTIPRGSHIIKYKITRGSLLTEEADELGREIPPRTLVFGAQDSVYISVKNWEDLGLPDAEYITYIVDKIPESTPSDALIYYVGDINGWYPGDKSLILQKTGDGSYSIRFPKNNQGTAFKFTRGDWSSVEVDQFRKDIDNRHSYFGEQDTIYLQIQNWKDR
ncbi:MAG: hypothetical protein U9R60_14015 [Bacteroidota bacterium]|nr:hypothetical protein [Bacteroidota bacterium]